MELLHLTHVWILCFRLILQITKYIIAFVELMTTFSTTNYNDTEQTIFLFAIRFYAWSVPMFSEEKMCDTRNAHFDVGYHFSKNKEGN